MLGAVRPLAVLLLAAVLAGCGGGQSDECAELGDEMLEALETLEQEGSTEADLYAFLDADSRFDAAGCNE